jgi:hypothetical protein
MKELKAVLDARTAAGNFGKASTRAFSFILEVNWSDESQGLSIGSFPFLASNSSLPQDANQ